MVKKKIEKTEKVKESVSKKGKDLYVAIKRYTDWTTGWSFDPVVDKPKELPEEISEALQNAIDRGTVKKV